VYEWSEVFMSIEGEGPLTGAPTAYIRFARCNFTCKGFNNPNNEDTTDISVIGFDPKSYKNITEIPLITKGCDSIYSWDEKFSHMWKKGDATQLAKELIDVLPNKKFQLPSNPNMKVVLSVTGGEPTLRAKFIPKLLGHELFNDLDTVLIETNASVKLSDKFVEEMNIWVTSGSAMRGVIWSNSPKLSSSGEEWKKAIIPSVIKQQARVRNSIQYLKFVVGDSDAHFAEVAKAVKELDPQYQMPVYVMPEACTEEQQKIVGIKVAKRCMELGYIYCHRVQNSVFGNGVGT